MKYQLADIAKEILTLEKLGQSQELSEEQVDRIAYLAGKIFKKEVDRSNHRVSFRIPVNRRAVLESNELRGECTINELSQNSFTVSGPICERIGEGAELTITFVNEGIKLFAKVVRVRDFNDGTGLGLQLIHQKELKSLLVYYDKIYYQSYLGYLESL